MGVNWRRTFYSSSGGQINHPIFYAAGRGAYLFYSYDGIEWIGTENTSTINNCITSFGPKIIFGGSSPNYNYSSSYGVDGLSETARPTSAAWTSNKYSQVFGKLYVGATNTLIRLDTDYIVDGQEIPASAWESIQLERSVVLNHAAETSTSLVFCCTGGVITSVNPDGVSVTQTTVGATLGLMGIAFGPTPDIPTGRFVTVAGTGNMYYSDTSDPHGTWTNINVGSVGWSSITYGGGKFISVGQNGYTAYSSDGINWTLQQLPSSAAHEDISYSEYLGIYVAAGPGGNVPYSYDGINWTGNTTGVGQANAAIISTI